MTDYRQTLAEEYTYDTDPKLTSNLMASLQLSRKHRRKG